MSGTAGLIVQLNIELKEDSPEVLAAVAGKPTKYYLSAAEFEILRAFVNEYAQAANDALVAIGNLPTTFAPVNATVNSTDAVLKDRANHTGTQLASTISNFKEKVLENLIDRSQVLAKKTTYGASVSGTVSEAILEQFTIAAGTLAVEDVIDLFFNFYSNAGWTGSYSIKVSNRNSLAGATQIAYLGSATNYNYFEQRLYVMPTGIGVQFRSNGGASHRIGDVNAVMSRIIAPLNLTQPIYVFFTTTSGNVGRVNQCLGFTALKY